MDGIVYKLRVEDDRKPGTSEGADCLIAGSFVPGCCWSRIRNPSWVSHR